MEAMTTVHSIFLAKDLAVSIATYFKLIESVDSKIDSLISKEYNSAIQMLEQVRYISNPSVYSTMLVSIIDRFNQAIQLEKRERQLLAYLGLMICYFYLGEVKALQNIQNTVAKLDFDITFWEKYGGDIEKGTMTAIGFAISVLGGDGGHLARAGGLKLNDDHQKKIWERQESFDRLKNAIVALKWQS